MSKNYIGQKGYTIYKDEISNDIKDALELAREEDTPRDMEIRFILCFVLDKIEKLRYDMD